MADIDMQFHGADQLLARMRGLAQALRQKPAQRALGRAAAVIRKQAKANAMAMDDPDTGRRIADNIVQRVRSRYGRATGDVKISIGVGTEKGRIPKGNPDTGPKGNTPHWHLVELGTQQVKAQPFLRPAAQTRGQAAINTFATELDKQLDKLTAAKK